MALLERWMMRLNLIHVVCGILASVCGVISAFAGSNLETIDITGSVPDPVLGGRLPAKN